MAFSSKLRTLIRKSDGSTIKITSDNGIKFSNYDNKLNLQNTSLISSENSTFIDYCFNINKNDTIYGLISSNKKEVLYTYINDKILFKKSLFTIDNLNENIKFLYINNINNKLHIFYFLINTQSPSGKLIHKIYSDNSLVTTEIDSFNFNILTNFVVVPDDKNISIFYFKIIKNAEELFMRTFSLDTNTWLPSNQITNSKNKKIYLSVIKSCKDNSYHISYSENINNQYYCTYINGYTKDNEFIIKTSSFIKKAVACLFPNIIEYNNILNIQWIEFNNLYSSISYDSGLTWSKDSMAILGIDTPFSLYFYKSNYTNDLNNKIPSIFAFDHSQQLLGIQYIYV